MKTSLIAAGFALVFTASVVGAEADTDTARLESPTFEVTIDTSTGEWTLRDRRSDARWPSRGTALSGVDGPFRRAARSGPGTVRLEAPSGRAVEWMLARDGRSIRMRWEVPPEHTIQAFSDLLAISEEEGGWVIVPCREGLLIPASGEPAFRRTFGTSDYEGSHMNLLGLLKAGGALLVTWEDAYVFPSVAREHERLLSTFELRRTARSVTLTPLGKGDWNTVARGYRKIAEEKGLAVTLREKIRRCSDMQGLIGASDFKLWTCLARRMSEDSTKEESVKVRWTFDEAAEIAEHLERDLEIDRCLFMMGGWTEGGYDCRHPDNLPANPECGGNEGLARAVARIQALGYIDCLHDNYQDMYRDAESWDPGFVEKRPDGSLITGGRWLGGRAYMVCAPKQLELAKRPQNLPGIHELFPVKSTFIDTTYAVGPRECHDPEHPLGRNDDIRWKARLSDYAREVFGLFGSECGREWALPHSDFFEGLVGVSGRYFHNLKPEELGAVVIPFWEMVYHDCQICWGKYGYSPERAGEYVAHHVLCARPLHYHSVPDHLYWKSGTRSAALDVRPHVAGFEKTGERSFQLRYAWEVRERPAKDWRVFVHFVRGNEILFQDDHDPDPATSRWKPGATIEVGPRSLAIPAALAGEDAGGFEVYMGLYDPDEGLQRAPLAHSGSQRRVLVGRLRTSPRLTFENAQTGLRPEAAYTRADGGWAEGLHPLDIFVKNTHEVLGPLHAATAHERLEELRFLSEDRSLRQATYGRGNGAVTVMVNFGSRDATVKSRLGGDVLLPPWGFVVEGPELVAFHAREWAGEEYPEGALFTLRSLDGKPLGESERVRVFHGFGSSRLRFRGKVHEVPRETELPKEGEAEQVRG